MVVTCALGTVMILLSLQASSVSGLTKRTFIQIGDLHYDPTYETTGESCNTDFPAAQRRKYGHFECDSPWALIEKAVHKVQVESNQADFVVLTGDNVRHLRDKDTLTEEDVLTTLSNITKLITDKISRPVYPVLGNHDYYPSHRVAGLTAGGMYAKIAEIWKPFLDPIGAMTSFTEGGYYSTPVNNTNILVAILNTNLYLAGNEAMMNDVDPAGQFVWFKELLTSARDTGRFVHVFAHVPPGPDETQVDRKMFTKSHNVKFNSIIREFSDVIIGMYTGHTHRDSFRIYYNKDKKPVVPLLISPSVTPWRWPGDESSLPRNPALRVVTYMTGADTYVLDWDQYYLDLTSANKKSGTVSFVLEYNLKLSYGGGIDNATAAALDVLVRKFQEFGSATFHDYYKYNTVSLPDDSPFHVCGCKCKEVHICAMQNVEYTDFNECVSRNVEATCGACKYMVTTLLPVLVAISSVYIAWL